MEIEYLGGGSIAITTKKATFIIDGVRSDTNLKPVIKPEAIYLATQSDQVPEGVDGLIIDSPGEYEVSEVTIVGVAARNAMEANDKKRNVVYKLVMGDFSLCIVGNIDGPLSEQQLEDIGVTNMAVIPIGGNGYTLDAKDAAQVVKQLEVKAVIPVHYREDNVTYEVPQDDVEAFIAEVGGQREDMNKLKIKQWQTPATLTVYILNK